MKKIKQIVVLMVLLLSVFATQLNTLKATSERVVVEAPMPGLMASIHTANGMVDTYIAYIRMQDKLVYCIEPLVLITNGDLAIPSDQLDATTRKKLSYISSSGYNTKNRMSDKWYAATQLYIWEALGYSFQLRGFDDYALYRQEIVNRVESFETLPSFHEQKITLTKGIQQVLQDQNAVLNNFHVIHNQGSANMAVEDNQIRLWSDSNAYSEGKIHIQKVEDNEIGLPIVYQGATQTIQKVIKPFLPENIFSQILYRVQSYGKVKFNKVGEKAISTTVTASDFGKVHTFVYQSSPLAKAKVELYAKEDIKDVWGKVLYAKGTLVETMVSDTNAVISKLLPSGMYYAKETQTVNGYVLDESQYDVNVSSTSAEIEEVPLTIVNNRSKVDIQLQKVWEEGSLLDLSEAYKDVVFGVYAREDVVVDTTTLVKKDTLVGLSGITKEGHLKEKVDLPLGNYYVKELQTNEHFVVDEKQYDFSVKANGKETIVVRINGGTIKNHLHRSDVEIHKVDKQTEEPLKASFTLYDANHKEVLSFMSEEDGSFLIEDLVDGTYYLQEMKAPKGYHLDSTLHTLEVKEDMSYTIHNQKVVVNASIETNDSRDHKPFELGMIGSMSALYYLLFRKLSKM